MEQTSKAEPEIKPQAEPNPPSPKSKILFAVFLIVGAVAVLGLGIWYFWLFGAAELSAKCDNGYTVWRRDPGAWSSYVYEIRNGVTIVESDLRINTVGDALGETHCTFLGGG